jgi:hypothetical protein
MTKPMPIIDVAVRVSRGTYTRLHQPRQGQSRIRILRSRVNNPMSFVGKSSITPCALLFCGR